MTIALWVAAAVAGLLTLHTAVNARLLRRPTASPPHVESSVAVLLPVRDEVDRLEPCLRSVLAQRGVPDLEVIVLDDGSTDGTPDLVRQVAGGDPRLRLVHGGQTPPGWLGKPYAAQQLASLSTADVLVFLDADVVLAPHAVAAAVELSAGFDLMSPYPRLLAESPAERLVQPLLPWSWLTFLPVRAMERSARPSLTAASGQFLVIRRAAYDRAGGHAAVRADVVEDIALARAVKATGGRVGIADGSPLATCRMYGNWAELRAGYAKSAWAAFGSPAGAVAVATLLTLVYVAPPVLAVVGAVIGAWSWLLAGFCAYGLGVLGRVITARTSAGRVWPDVLGQPASIAVFAWLVIVSLGGHRRGTLTWKGRAIAG